ncbi:unnamed protein product [Arctogadus glacialis]
MEGVCRGSERRTGEQESKAGSGPSPQHLSPGCGPPYMPTTVLLPLNQGGGGGDVAVGWRGPKRRLRSNQELFLICLSHYVVQTAMLNSLQGEDYNVVSEIT